MTPYADLELHPDDDPEPLRPPKGFRGCIWGVLAVVLLVLVAAPRPAPDSDQGRLGAPQSVLGRVDSPSDSGAPPMPAAASQPVAETLGPSTPAPLDAVTRQGIASWYAARGDVASVPTWRPGMDPYWATVERFADGRTYSVTVLVVGFCQCLVGQSGERLVDLSDGAFRQLAPLRTGLIRVSMTTAKRALPATEAVQ